MDFSSTDFSPTDSSPKGSSPNEQFPEQTFPLRTVPQMMFLRTDISPTDSSTNHIFHFRDKKSDWYEEVSKKENFKVNLIWQFIFYFPQKDRFPM